MITRKAAGLVALAVGVALPLSACGDSTKTSSSAASGDSGAASAAGGTLYYLTKRPSEHLDPQRTYIGRDLANLSRTVYRSLVQFPSDADPAKSVVPQPDLATDTGTSSEGGKVWKFTLKDGVKWEDGKDVTCEDLKYGVSRTFATDVITGGPNYILGYLDIPGGAEKYNGPYKKVGQDLFDKAITCEGKTITYKFNKPWADFPMAIAALRSFDPYRADKDQGDKSNFAIFSNGPYKLQGAYEKGKGWTLVRNDQYDAKTDTVRKALPDKIVFVEGLTNEIIAQRLIADGGNDKFAVTDRNIPPAFFNKITGDVEKRATLVDSPFTDYLLPNFNRMKDVKVRQALALATNKTAYTAALGGEKSSIPAVSIINPSVPGYKPNPAFANIPNDGDIEGAKKLLAEAGVKLPYPITFTYPGGTPTSDNSAAALQDTWNKAGFQVTLQSLPDTYYDIVQNRANDKSDVVWGGWGADWPGISTVIPPLFDSRINFSEKSNGQDYGNYSNPEAEKMMDDAAAKATLEEQAAAYAALDEFLGKDVAYIPLDITKFYTLHGSKVANFATTAASNMYVDLAVIGLNK